ncbi:hypothetical protein OGH69_08885 [Flavobacterium sp. MFBS3-15]|uniref:hypothetical protein n=1 Tax=Flavobacterium sp. MFBS3-15 TaxID=2989816 RepID=UPI002236B0D7|nr:hypothetical protein [Flavobacterium sp. MFBS3-15]MCW4469076.1 hypothetical protein [Flavobacterium sp. MFBS3-15]
MRTKHFCHTIKLKLFLLLGFSSFAQEFTVSAKISPIKESGPHVIYVGSQFRTLADENPEIIRILDSKNKEVPYFLEYSPTTVNEQGFRKFPIIAKNSLRGKSSSFTIENTSGGKMQELTLAIANTDAVKTYSISGSNDNKEFFGLVNNQILDGLHNPADTKIYKTLYLPLHNYKYIRIDFDDKKTLPVNLLEAGQLTENITPVAMEQIAPYVKIENMDGGKKTRISVKQEHRILINRMVFDIKAPSFYKRSARILVNREETVKRKKRKNVSVLEEFELDSSTKNAIDFLHFEEQEFVIEIDNQDNPPLDITSVKFYQAPIRIVADLKAGETYTMVTGNEKLGAALYDFINFKDKLPKNLPVATLSDAKAINAEPVEKSPTHNPWIMWVCIAAGAGIVIYFCISMVKDMKDK